MTAEYASRFLDQLTAMALAVAPWLLLGLVAAGLIRVFLPTSVLQRWLGKEGWASVVKAALIGTPLPLCSCSVIPVAIGLRRQGASRGATASFLIATPENGADSIILSYALLGPFMMIVRPIAAIVSAVLAGLLTELMPPGGQYAVEEAEQAKAKACCHDGGCESGDHAESAEACHGAAPGRLRGVAIAVGDILDDIAVLLLIGVGVAALIGTFIPAEKLIGLGSGLPAMLAMLVIGLPMYICATASTPIAAAMLIAGISPGTVLVFLLAGPATNVATMAVVRRELGGGGLAAYLLSISVGAVGSGLLTDWAAAHWGLDIVAQAHSGQHTMGIPAWLSWSALVVLALMAIRPLRRAVIR